jgi:hypothetical protein
MTLYKMGRKIIPIFSLGDSNVTRYERAQTRGCWDLRWAGPNSEVRIIKPANQQTKRGGK